ncbi:MAG: methyltransferase domain-containing protein [Candidatus Lokiarchaeota archaeon]|nr:methyltransferase domain-containing protein [Candidatus Lokiarchaeota archaeon]
MKTNQIDIKKGDEIKEVIAEKPPPKSFLKSDNNVVELVKELDLVLNKIEDLDYASPGLEIIYETIYNLNNFVLEMKQLEYDKDYFNRRYMGMPPWEDNEPRSFVKELIESGLSGKILDVGCGTGANVIYLAKQGLDITGIDFSEMAIMKARDYAKKVGIEATFFVRDFFNLPKDEEKYDTIIDCGLYHSFSYKDKEMYAEVIESLLNPGGTLYMFCTNENFGSGPKIVPKEEIENRFKNPFIVNSIKKIRLKGAIGNMKGWLVSITYP